MHFLKVIAASSMLSASCTLWLLKCMNHVKAEESIDVNSERVCDVIGERSLDKPRIAVIGAGIGGSSATHFLRKLLGSSASIDVYEKSDRIGGRLSVVTLGGETIEAGGTIIHSSNQYMVNFTEEMGLKQNVLSDIGGKLGIYNGKEFVFKEGKSSFFNSMSMMWRYGVFSLWRLDSSLKKMLKDFQNIYKLQEDGEAFETVPDMLRAMGGDDFFQYTQKTMREVLKHKGIGDGLIDELATAVSRCNYGQDSGVNGFTGYVSLAGAQGGHLWNVQGGNYQVCQKLLKASDATVHINTKIHSIRKEVKDGRIVYFLDSQDQKQPCSQPYDAVVVASPIEIPTCFVSCPKCLDWPDQGKLGKYQKIIANFIQASLNYRYFGHVKSADDMPDNIFTTEEKSLPFLAIGFQVNVNGEKIKPSIYKIFSRTTLSDETVNQMFEVNSTHEGEQESTQLQSIPWLAYPHYTPPEMFSPFKLDDGVFYVNAIERAASAMEMSAIGGRNAALLVSQYLKKLKEKK